MNQSLKYFNILLHCVLKQQCHLVKILKIVNSNSKIYLLRQQSNKFIVKAIKYVILLTITNFRLLVKKS